MLQESLAGTRENSLIDKEALLDLSETLKEQVSSYFHIRFDLSLTLSHPDLFSVNC